MGNEVYISDAPALEDRGVHTGILDAHIHSEWEEWITGEYIQPSHNGAISTRAAAANTLYAVPLWIPRLMTLDRIAIFITGAAGGGNTAYLGIYNNGTNMYPGTLVLDAGTVAIDAAVLVSATINQQLAKGWYWLALLPQANVTIRNNLNYNSPIGLDANLQYSWSYWSVAQAHGALPDPYTAGGNLNVRYLYIIAVRVSSLD